MPGRFSLEAAPQGDDEAEFRRWTVEQMHRIAATVSVGSFYTIRLDQLDSEALLPRPRDGDVAYFTAAAQGFNQQGLYEFDEQTSAWRKL
jgi:hypothetical protein